MRCSPLSSFGDDFTILCQNSPAQQNRKNDRMIHPKPDNHINSNSKEEMETVTITVTEDKFVETSQVKDTFDDKLKNAEKITVKCKIPKDIMEKYGSKTTQRHEKKVKQKKKGKKWKKLSTVEMGFNISLFPRPTIDNLSSEKDAEEIFNKIERECDELESLTENYEKLQDMEGCLSGNMKLEIRADRDRKVEKAHNQVKTKYCKNVTNNKGRKLLYIHHRIYKLVSMVIMTSLKYTYMPSRKKEKITLSREEVKNAFTSKKVKERNVAPQPPPQNLAYALDNYNASTDLDSAMVNILIGLQHRDLTPEDYELLLRLDEQVAPKTVSSHTIRNFKTETIDLTIAGELCTICMEVYEVGQTRKFLPCAHHFHSGCIEMWLTNSSVNCPIDNLPVEPS